MVVVEGDKEDRVHDGEDHRREQGAAQDELEPGVRDGVLGLARANTNLKKFQGTRLVFEKSYQLYLKGTIQT